MFKTTKKVTDMRANLFVEAYQWLFLFGSLKENFVNADIIYIHTFAKFFHIISKKGFLCVFLIYVTKK